MKVHGIDKFLGQYGASFQEEAAIIEVAEFQGAYPDGGQTSEPASASILVGQVEAILLKVEAILQS